MAITGESQQLRAGIRNGTIDQNADREWWEYVVQRIYEIERTDDYEMEQSELAG